MATVALYNNVDGKPVTHASYSSRQTFKHCPREFELTRIQGWRDKSQRAAPLFGKCVEAGVQAFEESGRIVQVGVDTFTKLWQAVKTTPDFDKLTYTRTEGDWASLLRAGEEMLRLYAIKVPHWPIVRPVFQQTIRKTIFPNTHLDAIENKAVLDMLSFPPAGPLIIDIKTTGGDLDEYLVKLDPQLAEYAWQTAIPDVGFLWFVKHGHGIKRGSRVSLMRDTAAFPAGFELWVVAVEDATDDKPAGIYVGKQAALDELEALLKGTRGKARDALEAAWLTKGILAGTLARVYDLDVTKQRIQFATAHLSEQDLADVGRTVAQTTVEMVRAHEEGYYPQLPGIRFPNEKCNFCAMRWICLNNSEGRDQYLTRKGEEWLDGVQGDEL